MSSDLGKLAEAVAEMKTRQVSPPSSVDEKRIALLLGVSLEAQDVTDWANRLAGQYQMTWSRRQRFGGLLFELVKLDYMWKGYR